MIGDIVVSDGEEFEVVWAGGEGLIGSRPTKVGSFWSAPKRIYNKKSDYWNEQGGIRLKRGIKPLDNPDKINDSTDELREPNDADESMG